MKITRFIPIAICAVFLMIEGRLFSRDLTKSGGERGFRYGNLWVHYYSVQEQGIINLRVKWLIAIPAMPTGFSPRADGQLTYSLENGKDFSFSPDSKHLIWVDPDSGPKKVSADLTEDLIQRIDQTKEAAKGKSFKSGEEFLTWVQSTKAEPTAPSDGDKPSN